MLETHRAIGSAASLALAVLFALCVSSTGCGPTDPLEQARLLQDEAHDYKGSLEVLRAAIDAGGQDPELHYRYGAALAATGDVGLAVWPLKKAMESPEWHEKAGLPLALALMSTGAYDEVIKICNDLLEKKPDSIPVLLVRANALMYSRRDYEATLADADRVLELDPENKDALTPRAVALLALGRPQEAGVVIDQLEALYRDDSLGLHGSPSYCATQAVFAKEKGEIDVARQRFESCLEKFPTEGTVLTGAVEFFDQLGEPERSNEIIARALEAMPESYSYRSTLAVRLDANGEADEAEKVLRAGTQLASREAAAQAWAGVASFNVDHGDYGEAIEAFEKARQLEGQDSAQLALGHADALIIAGRFDEAIAMIDQIALPAHKLVLRARVELARGNPAGALKLFDEGMRQWPNNAVARYYAAIAAEQVGNFRRAIEEYRYAMRIDPQATDAYLRLARLQVAAGNDQAALTTLNFSPGGRPDEVAGGLLEARVLARLDRVDQMPPYWREFLIRSGNWGATMAALAEGTRERSGPKEALKVLRAAKPLHLDEPEHGEALAAMIEDLAAVGRSSEGLALVEAALRKHPDHAPFHALRGRALVLRGAQSAGAREAFQRALELDPKNTRALLGLGRIEAGAGQRQQALELFDRALAADPNERAAAREAAAILVASGRSEEAEKRLAALLQEHPYDAAAARTLAELRLERGVKDHRTVELARRAVRFKGGAEAEALVKRIGVPAAPGDAAAGDVAADPPDAG